MVRAVNAVSMSDLMPEAIVGNDDALLRLQAMARSVTLATGSARDLSLLARLPDLQGKEAERETLKQVPVLIAGSLQLGVRVNQTRAPVDRDVNSSQATSRSSTGNLLLQNSTTSGEPRCALTRLLSLLQARPTPAFLHRLRLNLLHLLVVPG